ncbi:MAG: hypothetical protein K6T77_03240 [candidate division WOR-3 bacterium]|nr:hypothetical protein [candidate division WOR-3 bacterium]
MKSKIPLRKEMKMRTKTAIFAITIFCFGFSLAGSGDTLKPSAVFVHPDARGKLPIIGNVAVVLTGVDQQSTRLLEDALALLLLAESVKVIYPSEKDVGKIRGQLPDPVEWAKKQGVNCLLTGTVVARCSHCAHGKSRCANEGVRAVSFTLIDVPEDKILLWALYEPTDTVTPTDFARSFISLIKENLKEEEKK